MTSTDAIAAKERICFDHELFVIKTNAFFWWNARIRAVMSIKLVFRVASILGFKAYCYVVTILLE